MYINDTRCATGVTSFVQKNEFLIFTKTDNLIIYSITSKAEVYSRRLERGSQIITIIPENCQIILQMPRGNLECIKPRYLLIIAIGQMLDAKNYKKAIDVVRRERINFNLIVDHNPVKFMENVEHFINDAASTQLLDLFITELQNADVTQSMYSANYMKKNVDFSQSSNDKVIVVCDRLLEIFKSSDRFTQSAITCLVKKSDIEAALQMIWNIKKCDSNKEESFKAVEDLFKYMVYLVNSNELFNIALGTYDLGLVLFVAQRSQRDPKEYIPFLQQFDGLEDSYCKFKIDCYLKRYDQAVCHISKCQGAAYLQESLQLIENHKLYSCALSYYEDINPIGYTSIAKLYGEYLLKREKYCEASIMFEYGSDISKSIDCAKKALDWKRCLRLLKNSNEEETKIHQILELLILPLTEAKQYNEAANLSKTIMKDSRR